MSSEGDAAPVRPFADALRAAIAARGIGLERIREYLADHGVTVSVATLSYWQSGRSRPERRSSLAAIGHLEEVLLLPPGHLSNLLGPPRPRGRWLNRLPRAAPPVGALFPQPARVEDAAGEVRWDDRLTRLSRHDLVLVGPDRCEQSVRTRHVLRADADGADRWVLVTEASDGSLPLVKPLWHCDLGRVVVRPSAGLVVAELLFDRALRRGEHIVIEHELITPVPRPVATAHTRTFRHPVREYVLEIAFDPAAVPACCERFQRAGDGPERVVTAAPGSDGSLLAVQLDVEPGQSGFRWRWS
ncbi:XRE family transcriptional regulator [Saccharothrix violaceirubra]|uniref:Uncharacterized protein n=1 Tax=Saccharothrix violaceirubra TaxID=413306 RepID=A0A7W7T2I8_9PSEU|nr:XRE family transcriptional regulator [Saccharothrix violaceirubra]MBB4965051.1 hypothetical protein [Saccharothrix violaceirubra]